MSCLRASPPQMIVLSVILRSVAVVSQAVIHCMHLVMQEYRVRIDFLSCSQHVPTERSLITSSQQFSTTESFVFVNVTAFMDMLPPGFYNIDLTHLNYTVPLCSLSCQHTKKKIKIEKPL